MMLDLPPLILPEKPAIVRPGRLFRPAILRRLADRPPLIAAPMTMVVGGAPAVAYPEILGSATMSNFSSSSSDTVSHTVPSGTNKLIVILTYGGSNSRNFNSCTFGGVALTSRATVQGTGGGSLRNGHSIWTLDNPAVSTANVVSTLSGAPTDGGVCCINVANAAAGNLHASGQDFSNGVNTSSEGPVSAFTTSPASLLLYVISCSQSTAANTWSPSTGLTVLGSGPGGVSSVPRWRMDYEYFNATGTTTSRTGQGGTGTLTVAVYAVAK